MMSFISAEGSEGPGGLGPEEWGREAGTSVPLRRGREEWAGGDGDQGQQVLLPPHSTMSPEVLEAGTQSSLSKEAGRGGPGWGP